MTKYNAFLTIFIISVISMVVFFIFYFNAIFSLITSMHELNGEDTNPFAVFSTLFSPAVIISGAVLAVSSLIYRIIGIVYVARNKVVKDGEKALWIVGFILMGFITAIVFLVMAKGRNFVD